MSKKLISAGVSIFAMAIVSPAYAFEDAAGEAAYDGDTIVITGKADGYVAIDSVSATKTPTPLIDTPQTISVISREQLDDQALQDIGDVLRYTPGASVGQGEGHRDQVTIRGQNTTADFFIDGIRDDVQYFRPFYNIERVEILKGANALIFGRGGGGGVINRVIKTPVEDTNFGTGTASVDTFGAYAISGDVNAVIGEGAAFRINGLYEEFNNHRDFFGGRRFAINPTIAAHLGEKTKFLLSYEYIDDDRTVDRGIPSEARLAAAGCSSTSVCGPLRGFNNSFFGIVGTNNTTLQAHIVKARFETELTDSLSINSTIQYANYDKLYQNIFPVGSTLSAVGGATTVTLDGYRDTTARENFISQGNLVWEGNTGPLGHVLLLGYEYATQKSQNARRDVNFTATGSDRITIPLISRIAQPAHSFPVFNRNRNSDVDALSFYIQDQISLGDHFDIIAGIRFDSFKINVNDIGNNRQLSRTDKKWSPRIGVIYKPVEYVSFYANYSRSFLPRSGDQFLTLSPTSANLAPETFANYEIGAKWDIRPNLSLTTAIFQLDRDNQSVAVDNNGNSVLAGSRTKGFEIQLVGQVLPNWQVNAGYSYLDAEQRNAAAGTNLVTTAQQFQVPEHQASFWNRYDFTEQFGLGLGLTHQSSQFARNDLSVRVPAYTRIDAAAYYDVNENWTLQVNVENLTGTTYFPSVHNNDNISVGKPFNARFTVKAKF